MKLFFATKYTLQAVWLLQQEKQKISWMARRAFLSTRTQMKETCQQFESLHLKFPLLKRRWRYTFGCLPASGPPIPLSLCLPSPSLPLLFTLEAQIHFLTQFRLLAMLPHQVFPRQSFNPCREFPRQFLRKSANSHAAVRTWRRWTSLIRATRGLNTIQLKSRICARSQPADNFTASLQIPQISQWETRKKRRGGAGQNDWIFEILCSISY